MPGPARRAALSAALFVTAALLGGGCDLSTKHWAEQTLSDEPGQSITIVDPYVDLSLRYNEGTAFSFVQDLGTARLVFGLLSLVVVIGLFVMVVRKPEQRFMALALGVVAGGAIGNGLDRIWRAGVVDFIQLNYPWGGSWPTFNVADVLVALGVVMLLAHGYRREAQADAASDAG